MKNMQWSWRVFWATEQTIGWNGSLQNAKGDQTGRGLSGYVDTLVFLPVTGADESSGKGWEVIVLFGRNRVQVDEEGI